MKVSPLRPRGFMGESRIGKKALLDNGSCAASHMTSLHDQAHLKELSLGYSLCNQ